MLWSSLLVTLFAAPATSPAQAAGFGSIELRGGGIVTVRHGAAQRVTVVAGNPDREIRSEGDRLVIEPCGGGCPRGHSLEVEVVTPELESLAVSDGGLIQLVGDFPAQGAVSTSVSDGGTIDIRPLDAGRVSAAVWQGGQILTRPGRTLSATVSNGGIVTYWGNAEVTSSVTRGRRRRPRLAARTPRRGGAAPAAAARCAGPAAPAGASARTEELMSAVPNPSVKELADV